MFHKELEIDIGMVVRDREGRFIILELAIGEFRILLVNVYGPNEDSPSFYVKLFDLIDKREIPSMLLAGDFNVSMDPELDLLNNKGSTHVKK